MPLTFIFTPRFRSPILEENAVSVRNDTCTATLLNCYMYGNPFSTAQSKNSSQ